MAAEEKQAKKEVKRGIWSRRDFFTRLGWGGFGIFGFFALLGFIRSAFPRVLFQPPTTFKGGRPEDFPIGEVSERFKQEFRVWIIREADGFYAIFAKCTHLGCTPRWLPAENKFKCPCHGSGFFKDGTNFEGPAPRPLDRFKIAVAADGQLLVDKGVVYRMAAGGDPDEQFPQSILKV